VLRSVQRFRTVSNQPFLDRGTVRRGRLGVSSILRFASELKNRLLHIFRFEAKANAEAAGGKRTQAQEPRGLAETGRGYKWEVATASLRDVEGHRLCRRRHACAVSATAGHRFERSEGCRRPLRILGLWRSDQNMCLGGNGSPKLRSLFALFL
jgi:hypothetical protein